MKTLRKKISTPFILVILMIPLMFMILFNLAMNVYLDRTAKEELRNNVAGIEVLIRQQLMDGSAAQPQSGNASAADGNSAALQEELQRSKLALLYNVKNTNTEFLLISADGTVLFPKSFENSFLSERLVERARSEVSKAGEDRIVEFRMGRVKYYAAYQSLTNGPDATQLLFLSSGSSAKRFVRIGNLILLCITVLAVGISSIIALSVSKSISNPITRLTGYAKSIGDNQYLSLQEDDSSVEIHELTWSMNEMSSRLQAYDNAQKSFLQNASHELRTPLMSIQGYAEGIVQGVFTNPVQTAGIICEESRRLNALVEELLTLSRIENKNYKNDLTVMSLPDAVREFIQRLSGYAMKEGKSVRLTVANETIAVKIDEALLAQAVINIVSNCIKYAKNEVVIALYDEDRFAVIRISDDGSGIAAEDLPHIFERFYKGKEGNFGLGLSIAKSAVEGMGGSVHATNGDTGAVFAIRLPLV